MEVVIILIVVGILGYVFYQTLPNPKFQKANSLFDSGNFVEAIKILESIFEKHADAPSKLAECKLKQGQQAKSKSENEAKKYFNEVIEIKKRLPSNSSKAKYELVEAKAQFEIASILFNTAVAVTSAESKVKNLKDNLRFIDNATKSGIENDFEALRKKHSYELAEMYFQFGLQNEKSKQLSEAIQNYSTAKDFASESSHPKIPYNASTRIAICKLKAKPKDIEFVSFTEFNKADQKYAHDFFYRYVLFLLKKESYTDAETILKTHLNLPTQTIEKLKELLKTKQIKQAIRKVEEINTTIEQLYEKSFPVDEVKALYENLDVRINEIKTIIPNIAEKLQVIKPSLFNRLLSHYISTEQYGNGINLIQKFSLFWESPELLKNLGICCYGYAAKGNLSDKTYRIVISNWLTSVFSDKVILKSLEATTWDDNYTFSLTHAIGSNYQQHSELPDNANYEDVTDTNISIGTTQRELLQQFESLLHKTISNPSLSKVVHDYYTEEKEAIEKIVSVINSDMLFAAPHFAKSYGLNEEIIKELDNDYVEYSNEESLEAGIPYLKNNSDTYVREYATARETVSTMVSAIKNENLNELKSIATDKKRTLIKKYETINNSLEDSLFNAFTLKIEHNDENENLIPLMEECIRYSTSNEKLKYQYSNYVTGYCIAKVNANEIDNFKALTMMNNAYTNSKENSKICKNIVTLIRFNLLDILNDRTRKQNEIFQILDEIKNNRSETFRRNSGELAKSRTDIIRQLKEGGVDISLVAPDESRHKSLQELIRSQMSDHYQKSLTSEGEKMKKILAYMSSLSQGN